MSLEILLAGQTKEDRNERIANSNCDKLLIRDSVVRAYRFQHISFKETTFQNCTFSHCYFERCYFRKADFSSVSFVGCRFIDCTFDHATFSSTCNLGYAEFDNCAIEFQQISETLPSQQNVLFSLARNLKVNAARRGNSGDYREFLLLEIKASEEHNWNKITKWKGFYAKYGISDRVVAVGDFVGSKLLGILWGHGEIPWRVLRAALFVVAMYAFAYWKIFDLRGMPNGVGFWECSAYSIATFATLGYGSALPSSLLGRFVANSEAVVGLVLWGFLVASIYTRFSKR